MKKTKYTTEQIVKILREAETSGVKKIEICRKYKITEQTFYRWKRTYQGMDENQAKKLKELEKENARLKKLLAERDLEIDVAKELLAKKW